VSTKLASFGLKRKTNTKIVGLQLQLMATVHCNKRRFSNYSL